MKDLIKRLTNSMIYTSIAAIVAALILICAPELSVATLGVVAGIILLAWGVFMLFLDSKMSNPFIPFEGMIVGVIAIISGITLLSNPASLTVVLLFAIGIWIVVSALNNLKLAFALKKSKAEKWLKIMIFGVIDLIIGALVILNPFSAALSASIFIGIMLLIHAVLNLIDALMLRKDVKNLEKAFRGLIEEAEIINDPTSDKKSHKKDGKTSSKA